MSTFKVITAPELANMLQQSIQLVDVRTENEVAQGKIAGCHIMPLHELPEHLPKLDKQQPTVFYCRIGARSAQAAEYALSQGWSEVYNLQGGILAWVQAGLPVAME